MNNKIKVLIFSIFVVFTIWFYFAPHRAVDNMKTAVESKDAAVLSEYVDYPALKENLKMNINSTVTSKKTNERSADPLATLGAAMAAAFIEPMIDKLITPEGLSMMLRGYTPQSRKRSRDSEVPDTDFETSMGYENFDSFVVTIARKTATENPVALIFNREGLFSWKLSGVRLPSQE